MRGWSSGLALALIAILAAHHANTTRLLLTGLSLNDFGKFYYAAERAWQGAEMYPAAPVNARAGEPEVYGFINLNPPHFHLLVLPLTLVNRTLAFGIWMVAGLAALAWALITIARELELRIGPQHALWLLVAVLGLACMEAVIVTGQPTLFLLVPLTLAWRTARRGRWRQSGGWLGLLASLKPFVLLYAVWFIAHRNWRALSGMATGFIAAFAIGLAVFGVAAHAAWARNFGEANWAWAAMNASALGAWSRWLAESPFATPVVEAPFLVQPLWLLTVTVVGVTTFWRAWRLDDGRGVDRAFALLMLAALLISPLGWVYYWWLALPPAIAVFSRARPALFRLAVPFLFAPLGLVVAVTDQSWVTVTIGSGYFWGTLFLWAALLGDHKSSP